MVVQGAAIGPVVRRFGATPSGPQGATNSVQSVSQLIGPFLFTLTFACFIGPQVPLKLPGAPFLLAPVLALLIAVRATAKAAPVR